MAECLDALDKPYETRTEEELGSARVGKVIVAEMMVLIRAALTASKGTAPKPRRKRG